MNSKYIVPILVLALLFQHLDSGAASHGRWGETKASPTSQRQVVPDTTGISYFMYNDTVSTRNYMAVVQRVSKSFLERKTMDIKDAIAIMPRSKIEFFPFYFCLTGEGAYYRQYKEGVEYAYHLVWKTACEDSMDKEHSACFYVALNLDRLSPSPSPFLTDEYYGNNLDGMDSLMYYEEKRYRFLCLYSTFNDDLKDWYKEWYEMCVSMNDGK